LRRAADALWPLHVDVRGVRCRSQLGRDRNVPCATHHTTDGFSSFFVHKTDGLHKITLGQLSCRLQFSSSRRHRWRPCTEAEVRRVVMSAPVKSSTSLDRVVRQLSTSCCHTSPGWLINGWLTIESQSSSSELDENPSRERDVVARG